VILGVLVRLVLARHRPTIVGVTGSVGKTTTKNMIGHVLSQPGCAEIVGRVERAVGTFNSNVGLPLTLLGFQFLPTGKRAWLSTLLRAPLRAFRLLVSRDYPRVLVLEYGAGWISDVPLLVRVAPPTVAVVTAIGPAHLERFGSEARVARHKGALVRAVPARGLVILGTSTTLCVELRDLAAAPVRLIDGRGREFAARAAVAVAQYLGVPDSAAESAVASFPGTSGRLAVQQTRLITLIDDAYNANPLSMMLALDTLAEATQGRRRVAILGSMAELGVDSPMYHRQVAEYARERADVLIAVGDAARAYGGDRWFADADSCIAALPGIVMAGDTVLVKGSNSTGLLRVASWLRDFAG
jgi:UDP-N-acetylmuramoyl-tripeptide--D-alanyl-D-alanine ligase